MANLLTWAEKLAAQQAALEKLYHIFTRFKVLDPKKHKGKVDPFRGIIYREGQERLSQYVMRALIENQILIIQAGTGIGKSIGYLIPIFYMAEDYSKTQKRVILISTSTIALQHQLKNDVERVSEMLGIEVDISIVKGNNNYACRNCFNDYRVNPKCILTPKQSREINNLLSASESWDYEEIKKALAKIVGGVELVNTLWKHISLKDKCKCIDCDYRRECKYLEQFSKVGKSNKPEIIITNHGMLPNLKEEIKTSVDGIIIDEAHSLIEQARATYTRSISLSKIYNELSDEEAYLPGGNAKQNLSTAIQLISRLEKLIKKNAKNIITARSEKIPGIIDPDVQIINIGNHAIKECVQQINSVLNRLPRTIEKEFNNSEEKTRLNKLLVPLSAIIYDMAHGDISQNIFWLEKNGQNNTVLSYCPKNIGTELKPLLFPEKNQKPVVLTSATLSPTQVIKSDLGINDNPRVVEPEPINSPFSYSDCLLYTDRTCTNYKDPTHIDDLVNRIYELIKATNGRALILFTSKDEMKTVYDRICKMNPGQRLIIQDDGNIASCAEQFRSDEHSCLFATNAFWQGVDFPGATLSNLIITRLPFPSETPKSYNEKYTSGKSRDELSQENIKRMISYLAQMLGRGKRTPNDHTIYSILDPRWYQYQNYINYYKLIPADINKTESMDDVRTFSEMYILPEKEKEKGISMS